MSKQIKFVFELEDGQTIETNTINIVDTVINHLNSTSTSAALSANQGRVIGEKLVDLETRTRLIWQGNLPLEPEMGVSIPEASMYPDLFQDPGLFALKISFDYGSLTPDMDIIPFSTTVLIDTEDSVPGSTNFSVVVTGYSALGFGGKLVWGTITFDNSNGYVEFNEGYFYDFSEIEVIPHLTVNDINFIELVSIHRITRATD